MRRTEWKAASRRFKRSCEQRSPSTVINLDDVSLEAALVVAALDAVPPTTLPADEEEEGATTAVLDDLPAERLPELPEPGTA